MLRQIYLLIFPAAQGASRVNGSRAHWAILVPHASSETKGTVIQVTGTPFTGYGLEFKRNYDISIEERVFKKLPLAKVNEMYIDDAPTPGGPSSDVIAQDVLEMEAKKIEPPTASQEPLNPAVGRRCQEWTREYVEWLIKRNILRDSAALDILDQAKALEGQA